MKRVYRNLGRKCLGATKLKFLLIMKAYIFLKKCLGARNVLGLDFSWLVLGLEMSQGRKCFRAALVLSCLRVGLVSGPDLSQCRKCLRVGSVSRPEVSKSLWPEVSRGRKCLRADKWVKKERFVCIRIGISMLSEINYCGHVMRLAHFTSIEIVMEKLI